MPEKRKHVLKKLAIAIMIMIALGAGIYWYVATEKFADTNDREAAYTVSALDFIREFEENDNVANEKYMGKIVVVNGRVSEIEAADTTVNIKFINAVSGSYIIFAFQDQHVSDAKSINVGDSISVKGSCSGGTHSELLDTDFIMFKRCAINKN